MGSVLVLVRGYLPGFKSGGPVRSLANIVSALGSEFSFRVICSDRDLGDDSSYTTVNIGQWNMIGKARVFYLSAGLRGFSHLLRILLGCRNEIVYLNSFFDWRYSILPMLLLRFPRNGTRVILAPRGEFSKGALAIKGRKKRLYLCVARLLRLYSSVYWHASTDYEKRDIIEMFGESAAVRVAVDLPETHAPPLRDIEREPSCLRVVFLSRISKKKNLVGALRILSSVSQPVRFDVYGPIEEVAYWAECKRAAGKLPANVVFRYAGSVEPPDVVKTLAQYDLLFLPTFGENFGHVFAEALLAGLPILTSDSTPWRNLSEDGLGWDLPLEREGEFALRIEECYTKSREEYAAWRQRIQSWAVTHLSDPSLVQQSRAIFTEV